VQTFLTQRITAVLSEKLGTKVSVKGVNIEFFKTVVLEGIYIEDLKKDTLVFAEKLKADISNYNIDSSYFHFSKIGNRSI
jgi:hypothetical protein